MNKESDTPRTDEVAEGYWYSEMLNHAENLERELADMTKQRDALAALPAMKGDSHEKYTNNG